MPRKSIPIAFIILLEMGCTVILIKGACPNITIDHSMREYRPTERYKWKYSCYPGYDSHGRSSYYCDGNRWRPFTPNFECTLRVCVNPPYSKYSTKKVNGITVGQNTTYECKLGYKTTDPLVIICQADRTWTGGVPNCKIISCPPLPRDKRLIYSRHTLTYKSSVDVKCVPCRKLDGSPRRTCQANETWSGTPSTCPKVKCEPLPTPFYAELVNPNTDCGNPVTYKCKKNGVDSIPKAKFEFLGYTLCLESEKWERYLPDCYAPCIVDELANGSIRGYAIKSEVKHGASIDINAFNCDAGYTRNIVESPKCNNQSWSIWPTCVEGACPVPRVEHGYVIGHERDVIIASRTVVTFDCDEGYTISHNVSLECRRSELNLSKVPSCLPLPCEYIASANFTNVTMMEYVPPKCNQSVGSPISHGCKVTYSCGERTQESYCHLGDWTPLVRCNVTSPSPHSKPINIKLIVGLVVAGILVIIVAGAIAFGIHYTKKKSAMSPKNGDTEHSRIYTGPSDPGMKMKHNRSQNASGSLPAASSESDGERMEMLQRGANNGTSW